jgi:hypothetical protein
MLCARATLIAGPTHQRYEPGAAVRALVFARHLLHPQELKGNAQLKAIGKRGWTLISFNGHKVLPDNHHFDPPDSPEAQAFRTAKDSGIGILVIGPVKK